MISLTGDKASPVRNFFPHAPSGVPLSLVPLRNRRLRKRSLVLLRIRSLVPVRKRSVVLTTQKKKTDTAKQKKSGTAQTKKSGTAQTDVTYRTRNPYNIEERMYTLFQMFHTG